MSAPSTMNCERASQLLTELVCGELEADEAASVRAHAETCARCGPELSRFARVLAVAQELPLEAPAPAVEQRIMQAAREALSRRAGGAVAIDSGTPSGGIKAWLERLGTWAMSPQVAMASVLLLVVGIGLYALPFGEDSAPAALQLAQEPEGAPAPSAAAATAPVEARRDAQPVPAAPVDDLKHALEPAMEAPQAFQDELAEKASPRARRAAESKPGGYIGGKKGDASGELDGLSGLKTEGSGVATGGAGGRGNALGPAPAPKPVSGAAKDRAMDDLLESSFAPAPPPVPAERNAQAPRRAEPSAAAPVAAESADYEASAPVASTREEPAKQKAESPAEPSYATMLADGIAAAQAGNYARAVSLLDPVVASGPISMRPSARTWLARSLRGLGQCERALTYYAPLVDAPSPAIAILNEAADCYARVGRTAQAEELRMRAKASGGAKAVPVKAAPVAPATKE